MHDIEEKPLPEFAAIATSEDSTGDVLLKVVNSMLSFGMMRDDALSCGTDFCQLETFRRLSET